MSHDENGSTATDTWPALDFLRGMPSYDTLDDDQCRLAYLLSWWGSFLDGAPDTVSRATEAATNRRLYAEQRDAAARFLTELDEYPKPRRAQ